MFGWLRRLLEQEPLEGRQPNPVSGRPLSENPYGDMTFAPSYLEGLREQGYDTSDMDPWEERNSDA